MKYKINKKYVSFTKKIGSYQKVAEFFKISRTTAFFWSKGKAKPNHLNMQMIVKKSKGEVPVESWYV